MKTSFTVLPLLLLLAFPSMVPAQFTYQTNNGTITITGYTGLGGDVNIPSTIDGLPVTSIGDKAFYNGSAPQPYILTSVTIPDSVISIGGAAFAWCTWLRMATLGSGLRSIGAGAFADCPSLTGVYFLGNAPSLGDSVFLFDPNIVYYSSGTTGWGPTFGGHPTALWLPCSYIVNDGAITITRYTGHGGAVAIPSTINGLLVTSIGDGAFAWCTNLVSVTIPGSVTNIGNDAFSLCINLTNITTSDSVTRIGNRAFAWCTSLTNVTIGNSVNSIEDQAFTDCISLTGVYFQGNAPGLGGSDVFSDDSNATVYHLPGTTGWGTTFGGSPTAFWFLPNPVILDFGPSFGVKTNGFGFIISWATNLPVVVEASTSLVNPTWSPVATNTLTSGSSYFSDPQWTNYPARFYRLRSP